MIEKGAKKYAVALDEIRAGSVDIFVHGGAGVQDFYYIPWFVVNGQVPGSSGNVVGGGARLVREIRSIPGSFSVDGVNIYRGGVMPIIQGMRRGVFSNEAGLGSAPVAAHGFLPGWIISPYVAAHDQNKGVFSDPVQILSSAIGAACSLTGILPGVSTIASVSCGLEEISSGELLIIDGIERIQRRHFLLADTFDSAVAMADGAPAGKSGVRIRTAGRTSVDVTLVDGIVRPITHEIITAVRGGDDRSLAAWARSVPGEHAYVGLIGPNGTGKSMLFKYVSVPGNLFVASQPGIGDRWEYYRTTPYSIVERAKPVPAITVMADAVEAARASVCADESAAGMAILDIYKERRIAPDPVMDTFIDDSLMPLRDDVLTAGQGALIGSDLWLGIDILSFNAGNRALEIAGEDIAHAVGVNTFELVDNKPVATGTALAMRGK